MIVGEAGDLAGYANPGKLWKRMGLAPKEAYQDVTDDGKLRAGRRASCSPIRTKGLDIPGRCRGSAGERCCWARYLPRHCCPAFWHLSLLTQFHAFQVCRRGQS